MEYFVFEELDADRSKFDGFTKDEFIDNFEVTNSELSRFDDYLAQKARRRIVFSTYDDEIKLYLKAIYAEQLFGDEAKVQVINENNAMLNKVLQIASN